MGRLVLGHLHRLDQDRQGAVRLTAFGFKHCRNRTQAKRVGREHIECVGRNRDDLAPADSVDSAMQVLFGRRVAGYFDRFGAQRLR